MQSTRESPSPWLRDSIPGPEDICRWADGVPYVKYKLEEQYWFRMVNGGVLLEEDVPEEFKYFGRAPVDLIFSVNLDYLVCIAFIKYGKREEVPLEHQVTYKKVKSIKPNSDRLCAQNNLGVKYEKGQGVEQDFKEAVKWLRKAADQGLAGAQSNLGYIYANGKGVEQNFATGYAWWNIAATNGDQNAKKGLPQVAKAMTPAQKAKAEALAKEMVKKNPKLLKK